MYILTFDEDTAYVDGLPVRLMSILFNIVTGVAIALMIPAAGSLLVSTIMVLPASIALKLGKTFRSVMLLAVVIGFCWGWSVVSFFLITRIHRLVRPLPSYLYPSFCSQIFLLNLKNR